MDIGSRATACAVWIVVVGLALPFAAAQESLIVPTPEQGKQAVRDDQPLVEKQVLAADLIIELETYNTSQVLDRVANELGLTGEAGQAWLSEHVRAHFPKIVSSEDVASTATVPTEENVSWVGVELSDGKSTQMALDAAGCGLVFDQQKLLVAGPNSSHTAIRKMLGTFMQFGLKQVVIRTTVYRGSADALQHVPIRWSHVESESQVAHEYKPQQHQPGVTPAVAATQSSTVPAVVSSSYVAARQLASPEKIVPPTGVTSENWTEATSVIERSAPVLYTLLTPAERQKVGEEVKQSTSLSRVTSPQVVVFNGQFATVSDSVERPFVTGMKPMLVGESGQQRVEFTPNIRVYPEGSTMRMLPEIRNGNSIRLNYHLELCKIRTVETLELPCLDSEETFTVQIPEVAATKFRACVDMPVDHCIAIGTYDFDAEGKRQAVLILCQCSIRDLDQQPVNASP